MIKEDTRSLDDGSCGEREKSEAPERSDSYHKPVVKTFGTRKVGFRVQGLVEGFKV